MFELTELQRDALMETFNIGVGRASRSLSQMLGCETALSVPIIVQSPVNQAVQIIDPRLRAQQDVCMVTRRLGGIDAEAVMIFQGPRDNIASLLNLPAAATAHLSDSRENVATKIGQLVSESCAAQIEDLVGIPIDRGPVRFLATVPERVFEVRNSEDDVLIIVKIDIALKRKGVTGHLLLSFTQESAQQLAEGLDRMLLEGSE